MNLKKTFLFALLISLFAHLFLALFLQFADFNFKSMELAEPIWIELEPRERYFVDLRPPTWEKRPEDARFLGEYDIRVSEERIRESLPQVVLGEEKQKNGATGRRNTVLEGLGSRDYFADVKKGNHTYLNVLRFPGARYILRLKKAFGITWSPEVALEDDEFRRQLSVGKVEATVGFSIDTDGNLAEVFLHKSSGIDQYDQEAIRTIRASAPFASLTPEIRQLAGEDGLLRLSITFVVSL